jgi:hypothetical protein
MTKWIAFSMIIEGSLQEIGADLMVLGLLSITFGLLIFIIPPPHTTHLNILGGFYIAIGVITLVFNVIVVGWKD